MRTRYTFDANTGLLTNKDGDTLGRVVSITIDDRAEQTPRAADVGYRAQSVTDPNDVGPSREEEGSTDNPVSQNASRPTPTQLEREAIQRIWDYWIEISGKKQRFDSKRERMIRSALRMGFDEEDIKRALLGLWRNPWHHGENEQRKVYLEIRYALRGIGDESDDTRIEKAISWAAIYAPDKPSMPEYKVSRLLEDIRYTCSLPHRPERARGEAAFRELRAGGFEIDMLEKAPWARIRR
jgi:hypothetical protein